METKTKKEHVKRISDRELTISRLINAPCELVFEAWTNPEHIKHWWGPNGFTSTIYKMDVKEGGEWDFIMHGPDGKDWRNTHVFMEVVKNKKITILHATPPKFKLEATFTEQGNKTLLSLRSEFESAEQLDQVIKTVGADKGLEQNVDKLEAYMEEMPRDGKELVIMRQFNAPLGLVYKAWTEVERLAQWWGPKGMNMKITKLDLRPGGSFHYSMTTPDGHEMWGKFDYKEISAPNKIVFVSCFSNEKGEVVRAPFSPVWPLQVMNTLILSEHEGKTTVLLKGKPINATAEEFKIFESSFDNMQQGFKGTFDQLDEYLARNNK